MKKTIVAALCGAAALSHVQAAPVFQINSSLTDLSYQVVDLTPNDGAAAAYSVRSDTLNVSLRDSPNTPDYGVMDPPSSDRSRPRRPCSTARRPS